MIGCGFLFIMAQDLTHIATTSVSKSNWFWPCILISSSDSGEFSFSQAPRCSYVFDWGYTHTGLWLWSEMFNPTIFDVCKHSMTTIIRCNRSSLRVKYMVKYDVQFFEWVNKWNVRSIISSTKNVVHLCYTWKGIERKLMKVTRLSFSLQLVSCVIQ